ncbi:hypothetical protein AYR62_06170 [Secundilactobacillus paracollinoides]|uniref:TetR/AcrR family transcriptional regulator n=1 Tax=Secundilactobacillus paracollinoides TaxID=240427 RepID=UPI0006D1E7B5|nr:TetR/AcrR family transcriptional regulator [Secundilactobacillus paracollinoides]ANZ63719.1 hypothetical protein AYR62_06170 [Secundilactobacillus paracollinoides]KRL76565.1 hypothetical protein FC17_GL002070 [Secundilactobacillus paracollinoides DSM 15502 = JCM 11969]
MSYEETTNKIVASALDQIERSGDESLSLRQLAKSVGLTTGAFYKHFENKDALFRALTVIISTQLADDAKHQLKPNDSPKQQLLTLADVLLTAYQNRPNTMMFLFFNPVALATLNDKNTAFPLLEETQRLIRDLSEDYPSLDPQQFFVQIWSFIQGYGVLIKNKAVVYDQQLTADTLTALLGGVN